VQRQWTFSHDGHLATIGIAGGGNDVGKPGPGRASLATLFNFSFFDHSLEIIRDTLSNGLK
jgi:hypothetical protein